VNREFDLVKMLEREPSRPTDIEMARQRAALVAVIDDENARLLRRRPTRRVSRIVVRTLAATLAVIGVGGTAAFAVTRLAPDAKDAATVNRHYRSSAPVHRPGWRPELDAEHVVCDYRGLGLQTTGVYSFASGFPLAGSLTQARLVAECRSGTDATASGGAPIAARATLCAVTPPGEHLAVPVVTFVAQGCAPPLSAAAPTLLDERNRMRRAETAIRAVPQQCPTVAEARSWVDQQLAAYGKGLHLLPVETYPGGRCYLPFVHWGRGEVEITASVHDAVDTPGRPATTLPPANVVTQP
jgi:hypothetical protein